MIAGLIGAAWSGTFAHSVAALAGLRPDWTTQTRESTPAMWMAATPDCALSGGSHLVTADVVVAFDGRLRGAEGGRNGVTAEWPRWARDADAIACAYSGDDEALLAQIDGDFSFVLWDGRAQRALLATDPFAQRPLYCAVHQRERLVAFASNTRVLRTLPWVGSELDDATVVNLLLGRRWDPERTPFRNIRFIPPGHCLQWNIGDSRPEPPLKQYWGPRFAASGIGSRPELLAAFEHAMRNAIDQRLDRTMGSAILMSGGYDSTAIAGVAAALGREHPSRYGPLHTVSATFGTLPCDESGRIAMARAHNGLPGREVHALRYGLSIAAIERQVRAADFPLFNIQDALLNAELDAARAVGASTILMGAGGDDLAVDRGYDRDLLAARGLSRLWGVARDVAPLRGLPALSVAVSLARAAAPGSLRRAYRAVRQVGRSDPATAWLQPAVAGRGWRAPVPPPWGDNAGFGSYGQYRIWANLQSSIVQYGNRVTALDIQRRGFGYGAPLLDRRLFELVLGTDAEWLPRTSDAGQYKPLIAEGLRAYVPNELTRTYWKVDFGSYNRVCMHSALDEIAEWLFAAGTWESGRYVAQATAQAIVDAFRSAYGTDHAAADAFLGRLYGIVGVEAWLRQL